MNSHAKIRLVLHASMIAKAALEMVGVDGFTPARWVLQDIKEKLAQAFDALDQETKGGAK